MVTKATNYPTILVHGFLGVDQKNYFSYLYQYFGSFTKDLRKHWEEDLGYEVYQPALGPFTGMWERSCELYAYIFGGRVDYGVYHSQKHGIKRFGRTYEGVLKDLGTPGDHAKVNLIGHSFGGPTVTMFSWIMTEGCKEELDATPADEVSDFFKGGKGDMLHTVSTLSATNRGTAATVFAGDKLLHTISKVLMTAGAYAGDMINNVYDLYFDPWGAMEDPALCKSKALGKDMETKKAGITAYAEAYDGGNIWYEMKPSVSDAMLAGWKANPKTYYIAHPACGTHPTKAGTQSPDGHIFPLFKITGWILGNYTNKNAGIDKNWLPNDGIVNTPSKGAPAGVEEIKWTPGMDPIKPGVWHVLPAQNWDHQGWAGMFISKATYYDTLDSILESIYALPDIK